MKLKLFDKIKTKHDSYCIDRNMSEMNKLIGGSIDNLLFDEKKMQKMDNLFSNTDAAFDRVMSYYDNRIGEQTAKMDESMALIDEKIDSFFADDTTQSFEDAIQEFNSKHR